MFGPWYAMTMLALEASDVIGLRLMRMAACDSDAESEARLMVSEKVDAAIEAGTTLMTGGSPTFVINRYREHVAANRSRLLLA